VSYFRDLFSSVRARPSSYGLQSTYSSAVAFVVGCDQGLQANLLLGFHEWLAVRCDADPSYGWPTQVSILSLGEGAIGRALTPDEDARAREVLFGLLDEFLAVSEQPEGLKGVFDSYSAWLAARQGLALGESNGDSD
jgi:hypothetical protein